jgi:DNA-binding beta-propeller fold protein YncE
MKNEILKRPRPACFSALRSLAPKTAVLLGALLVTVASSPAAELDTITGGPSEFNSLPYGYEDGDTAAFAQFHTPWGIALDSTGTQLFVADRDNNAIRQLYLNANITTTFVNSNSAPINRPVGVAVDGAGNVYVLNRGNGNNGTLLQFDSFGDLVVTLATSLTNATGLALDGSTNLYVAVRGNTVLRITPSGVTTTIGTVTNAGASLQGIVVTDSGFVAACDGGRHGILLINPNTGSISNLTGFNGAGDKFGSKNNAQFRQPTGITKAGGDGPPAARL